MKITVLVLDKIEIEIQLDFIKIHLLDLVQLTFEMF